MNDGGPKGGALGLTDDQIERGEVLDEARKRQAADQSERDRALVEIAVARMAGELAVQAATPEPAAAPTKTDRDRGLGTVTKQALMAAFVVVSDTYGRSTFPTSAHAMARAIVAKAKEMGLSSDIEPRSTSVKTVAAVALEATQWLDNRENE